MGTSAVFDLDVGFLVLEVTVLVRGGCLGEDFVDVSEDVGDGGGEDRLFVGRVVGELGDGDEAVGRHCCLVVEEVVAESNVDLAGEERGRLCLALYFWRISCEFLRWDSGSQEFSA